MFTDTLDELYSTAIETGARALTLQSQSLNIDPSLTDTPSPSQLLVVPLTHPKAAFMAAAKRWSKELL